MIIKNPLTIIKAKLQSKTATPTTNSQTITADSGYDGLSSVEIDAVTSAIDSNITPTNIRAGVTVLGIEGNLEPDKPDQSKTVAPTTSSQIVVADTGYELASVTVEAVDSSIDSNITADNIKKDVTILGVTGTLEEGITPTGTINITENGTYDVTNYASANVNVQSGGIPEPTPTSASLFNITGNTITNYTGSDKDVVIPLSYSKSTRTGFSDGVELLPPDYQYVFGSLYSSALRMMEFEYDTNRKTYTSFPGEFYSELENDFPNGCFLINAKAITSYGYDFIGNIRYVDININGKLFAGSNSSQEAYDYIRQNNIRTIQFKGDYVDEIIVDGTDFPITNMEKEPGYYNEISNLTILDNITSIAEGTFGYTNLDTITIDPKNPKYISKGNCLIDKDTNVLIAGSNNSIIPEEVTSIGSLAFFYCRSLTTLTIPNSVTSIGRRAFDSCSKLTTVTIGSGVTSLGEGAFASCGSLTTITIPNSVTTIERAAFDGCTSLTSITIPNSVTSIGYQAFWGCSALTPITIPDTVTNIGAYAFYGCSKLTSMTIKATTPPTLEHTSAISTATTKIYIPKGTLSAYQNATNWSNFASKFVELSA